MAVDRSRACWSGARAMSGACRLIVTVPVRLSRSDAVDSPEEGREEKKRTDETDDRGHSSRDGGGSVVLEVGGEARLDPVDLGNRRHDILRGGLQRGCGIGRRNERGGERVCARRALRSAQTSNEASRPKGRLASGRYWTRTSDLTGVIRAF